MWELTDAEIESGALEAPGLALIDFRAPWCGPCRMMAPVLAEAERRYAGKLRFYGCNVDENMEAALMLQIASIPTLMLIRDGALLERRTGALDADALDEMLCRHLGEDVKS